MKHLINQLLTQPINLKTSSGSPEQFNFKKGSFVYTFENAAAKPAAFKEVLDRVGEADITRKAIQNGTDTCSTAFPSASQICITQGRSNQKSTS